MKTLMAKIKVCRHKYLLFALLLTDARQMIGEQCLVSGAVGAEIRVTDLSTETMASHRTQLLITLLPNALAFGAQEIDPEWEPLKVHIMHAILLLIIHCHL